MSSRRRTKAQESSDIEEGATQVPYREDVDMDDEDEQPRRRTKSKTEKKPQVNGKRTGRQEAREPDTDDEDPIDVENFADQPLGEGDLQKLNGLSRDWTLMTGKIQEHCGAIDRVAEAILEHGKKEVAEKDLGDIELLVKGFIDIEAEMQFHSGALDDIHEKLSKGETICDAIPRYNTGVLKRSQEYSAKTTRQKYAKNERYKTFKQAVYEVDHLNEPMPPMTELIARESGDESDDDDDIEVGGVTQDYKCPITLRVIEEPYTSKICSHSFSKAAIQEMFKNERSAKKCPASGCRASFRLVDCVPNKDLERKIKAYERRKKRAEEAIEVDEVIE
ncbi:zinc-finger of the MIZ type in Nse subunit-domain-containing protein [Desarmillaria tabescens]|uniref:Zinc-finger of the MIZ type in Nse subunit-domain-containing protein n=1 Tax=Armillaria tabescens TaxID=1929756 RepID=A0AA39NFG7_ARMTA|nr:zinc-finger of the MIZ type in Nse subunit-domain-containing protein [Desarmillaria tabescens]KAK0464677.1 zinc-finger of the MIZ type in Nse subunit-domain-containing protein [Desarmillaria tabescens]